MRIYLSKTRYYTVHIQPDLFGQTVIVRSWGGRHNRLGGMVTEPYQPGRLRQIHRERVANGYAVAH